MQKDITDLQALDVFTALNGQNYQVQSVSWVNGDIYKIDCRNKYGNETVFKASVHTMVEVIYSLKVGA
jgi:hypothetical protein